MKTLLSLSTLLLATLVACAERIELKTANASCAVETKGARVVSYKTAAQGEILWNDNPVQTEAKDWAHGGIPVCWPTFGQSSDGSWHGIAWQREFTVADRTASAAKSTAVFRLKLPEAELTYTVALTDESLRLTLETLNASDRDLYFESALHPYFRVGERDQTWIAGVSNAPFAVTHSIDGGLPGPKGSCKVYRIADKSLDRTISLYAEGSDGVCVWNPGDDTTYPGKLPKDGFRHYVCVEPSAGDPDKLLLAPGKTHALKFEIRPRKGSVVTGFAGRDARYPDSADKAFRLPFRAMFIGAHPDDAEYDFGVAAAKLVAAGAKVTFVSVCNGDNGHQTMAPADLAARRYAETQASAKVYGIERYIVMGEHDCLVEPTLDLRKRITRLIREFEPNMVVTHRTCDYHADHRATGQAVQDSTYLIGVPLFAPETPVPELLPFVLYGGDQFTVPRPLRADLLVNGEDVVETLVRGIACHESQLFEWLPPEFGMDPKDVPTDPAGRLQFVRKHAMLDITQDADQHRAAVTKAFGRNDLDVINVFEVCEYSRAPSAKERAFLAAIPGFKWTDGKETK